MIPATLREKDSLGRPIKHGLHLTPEHQAWRDMKQRYYQPKSCRFDRYGARGIKVCDRWLGPSGFINFILDMGIKPGKDYSLERIDNNGNYEPVNCIWATRAQQNRNRSDNVILEFDGKKMAASEWARLLGMNPRTLYCRIASGDSVEDALTIPVAKRTWRKSPGRPKKSQEVREKKDYNRGTK